VSEVKLSSPLEPDRHNMPDRTGGFAAFGKLKNTDIPFLNPFRRFLPK